MCTVTWHADASGYDVFFNRDERHARAPEGEPRFGWAGNVAYVAPRDGDHGGTWLLVNDRGVTVGLLNDYAATWQPAPNAPRFSRGHVVLAAASAESAADATRTVARLPLARVPAFTLFILEANGTANVRHWNGSQLAERRDAAAAGFLTSSSFATAEVCAERRRSFNALGRESADDRVAQLATFHRQHDPLRGAHSVLMRRSDAATRSVSHLRVADGTATFAYTPVVWPVGENTAAVTLPRAKRFHLALASADATR